MRLPPFSFPFGINAQVLLRVSYTNTKIKFYFPESLWQKRMGIFPQLCYTSHIN